MNSAVVCYMSSVVRFIWRASVDSIMQPTKLSDTRQFTPSTLQPQLRRLPDKIRNVSVNTAGIPEQILRLSCFLTNKFDFFCHHAHVPITTGKYKHYALLLLLSDWPIVNSYRQCRILVMRAINTSPYNFVFLFTWINLQNEEMQTHTHNIWQTTIEKHAQILTQLNIKTCHRSFKSRFKTELYSIANPT